jgi:hypothetical protein
MQPTSDEVEALKQILRELHHIYKTSGRGAYFLPGGWAGDRLLELLEKMKRSLPAIPDPS